MNTPLLNTKPLKVGWGQAAVCRLETEAINVSQAPCVVLALIGIFVERLPRLRVLAFVSALGDCSLR
jgi:hypothetical protein